MQCRACGKMSRAGDFCEWCRQPIMGGAPPPPGIQPTTQMPAHHSAHFDWTYPHDQPEMADLYRRAKEGQWNGDSLPCGS